MDAFFLSFWPNLAATIAGVTLGLPIALWVSRLTLAGAEQSARQSQAQRVDHALQVLVSAMKSNNAILRDYGEVLATEHVRWHLSLDTSAWDAIQTDFIAEMTDPALRREIAFHFSQLKALTTLNYEYLQFIFGTNASMSGAGETRKSIGGNLRTMCNDLSGQAERLELQGIAARKPLQVGKAPDA